MYFSNYFLQKVNIVVLSQLLLLLLPLATAVPIKIISYSATEEKHNHEMEGVPGEAVMGEFSFKVQPKPIL